MDEEISSLVSMETDNGDKEVTAIRNNIFDQFSSEATWMERTVSPSVEPVNPSQCQKTETDKQDDNITPESNYKHDLGVTSQGQIDGEPIETNSEESKSTSSSNISFLELPACISDFQKISKTKTATKSDSPSGAICSSQGIQTFFQDVLGTLDGYLRTQALTHRPGALDSLASMIKSTVDTWCKENAVAPHSDSMSTLKEDAQSLCDKFAANGEEALFLVVSTKESATSYQGTQLGMSFLDERSDVMDDFVKFCDDNNQEKTAAFQRKKYPGQYKESSSQGKEAMETCLDALSKRKPEGTNLICTYTQGIPDKSSEGTVAGSKGKKRPADETEESERETGNFEGGEFEPQRKKIPRKDFTMPSESDLEHYDDHNSVAESTYFETAENLPRSSRKIRLPAWRREYEEVLIDFTCKGSKVKENENEEDGPITAELRSCIPKFRTEGKFLKLEDNSSGFMTKYSCLQCRAVLQWYNLKRHWNKHREQKGNFPCNRCNQVFKRQKYLEIHLAMDHAGNEAKLSTCQYCDKVFTKDVYLEQHILKSHKDTEINKVSGTTTSEVEGRHNMFKCGLCQKSFNKNQYLLSHIAMAHKRREDGITDKESETDCKRQIKDGYPILGKEELRVSIVSLENDKQPYCKPCNRWFSRHKYYVQHCRIVHKQTEKTKEEKSMNRKKRTDPEGGEVSRALTCDLCNKSFTKQQYLNQHNNMIHAEKNQVSTKDGKPYCKICKRFFTRAQYYKQHVDMVHGKKNETKSTEMGKNQQSKLKLQSQEKSDDTEKEFIAERDSVEYDDDEVGDPDYKLDITDKSSGTKVRKAPVKKITSDKMAKNEEIKIVEFSAENKNMDIKDCYIKLEDVKEKMDLSELQCKVCFRRFSCAKSLLRHMRFHEGPDVTCSVCHKNCGTKFRLREHMRSHANKLICGICNNTFIYRRNLRRHLLVSHNSKTCLVCSKIIKVEDIEEHLQICEAPPGFVRCDRCLKIFKNLATLYTHIVKHKEQDIKTSHTLQKKLKSKKPSCRICGMTFEGGLEVVEHVKSKHPDCMETGRAKAVRLNVGWKCKLCLKEFQTEDMFALHQSTHGRQNYSCDTCGAKFSRLHSLNLHKKRHAPGVPYQCGICKKGFNYKRSLTVHHQTHRDFKEFICHKCGKAFRLQATLRCHMRVHNKDFWFRCEFCEKKFRSVGTLRSHWLISHPIDIQDRTFPIMQCETCGKKFAQRYKFNEHMASHTGHKPHKCPKCSLAFPTLGKLNYHNKVAHLNIKNIFCSVCKVRCALRSRFRKHIESDIHIENCKKADVPLEKFHQCLDVLDQGQPLEDDLIIIENQMPGQKKQKMSYVKEFVCSVCGVKFSNARDLFDHRKSSHTYCYVCCKKFQTAKSFLCHLLGIKHLENCKRNGVNPEEHLKSLVKDPNSSNNALIEIQKRKTSNEIPAKSPEFLTFQVVEKEKPDNIDKQQHADHQYLSQDVFQSAVAMETASEVDNTEMVQYVEVFSKVDDGMDNVESDINSLFVVEEEVETCELQTEINMEQSQLESNTISEDVEYVVITIPNTETVMSENTPVLLESDTNDTIASIN